MDAPESKRDQENRPEVEQWLDEALAQYAKGVPRPGLEGRVLARLAGAREQARRSLRWWGAFAFSAAAALVVMALWLGRADRKLVPQSPATSVEVSAQTGGSAASAEKSSLASTGHTGVNKTLAADSGKRSGHQFIRTTQPNTLPKLEQFPSPQPLSEQEKILVSYVTRYPETAALVAHARAEELEQDRQEEAAEAAQGSPE